MMLRRLPPILAMVATVFTSRSAVADDVNGCVRSYEDGQRLRDDGKLIEARAEFRSCAQDACPAPLRSDCTTWLFDAQPQIPSIAVRVHGLDGCDKPDAAVAIDGITVPHAADGRTIELNPGSHRLSATADGTTTDRAVVLSRGERNRIVRIDLSAQDVVCGVRPAVRRAPLEVATPAPAPEARRVPTLFYVFGGVGLAGVAVGGTFGAMAWSQKGTLDECSPHCARDRVDDMQRLFVVADIATAVSVVSLGIATVLYLTR